MKLSRLLCIAVVLLTTSWSQADVIWVGGVSSDVFDEANWDLSGTAVTVIDPNVSVADNILIGPGPFTNDPIIPDVDAQQRIQLSDGFSFTLDAASITVAGNDGVGGEPGSANGPTVNVTNGSQFNPFFVVNDVKVLIDGTSSATFGGGGNPINLSIVDMQPGAVLAFLNETPDAFIAEHLGKTFVNGAAAVDGVNISIASDGAAGLVITAVLEPSSMALALFGVLGLLGLRRRK